jgi:hypothetical protein
VNSGTAMPFFGEYYAAFGWIGMILLVIFYSYSIVKLLNYISKYSNNNRQYIMGCSFVAVYFAYYYYSRGSVAQISKGFVFAFLPFLILLRFQYNYSMIPGKANEVTGKRHVL